MRLPNADGHIINTPEFDEPLTLEQRIAHYMILHGTKPHPLNTLNDSLFIQACERLNSVGLNDPNRNAPCSVIYDNEIGTA